MADLQRAEKLAWAKKKLKQFQQKKHRDAQSESGRSTPSAKKLDEDGFVKPFHSENGGSSYSLSHSENVSSNISGTDSPVPTLESSMDNLCHIFNGSSQPDILNSTSEPGALPKVSVNVFQNSSPSSFFTECPLPTNCQSGSDFFDSIASSNEPSDFPNETSQMLSSTQDVSRVIKSFNTAMLQSPQINASTPEGPQFQDTPNYSFPDASFSPIKNATNNTSNEVTVHELEIKLKNSCSRNEKLEKDLLDQKNQVLELHSILEDMKKRAEEGASSLRDHVQAISILVSEKTELQNTLAKHQEDLNCKSGEVGELQGRLRASRHRVADLERELAVAKTQVQTQEITIQELKSSQTAILDQTDSHRKRIGDLELEISDLQSKLEARDEMIKTLKAEVEEKNSKLSLAEIRIQQLSGEPGSDRVVEDELRCKNEELLKSISSLESQLSATVAGNEEAVKQYQRYVNQLHTELVELENEHSGCEDRCHHLIEREQQLVQQVSGLERQLSRVPQPTPSPEALPELQSLKEQLRAAEDSSGSLQTQLQDKVYEVECLREGLQERALRIQELEMTVSRLEAEWPDTANLQAAIESDKVAASRAMSQNNSLKKQLEEMQQVTVQLSNSRDLLSRQLQQEQQRNQLLSANFENMRIEMESKKREEADKEQQTEKPIIQECEVQTLNSQPTVSPEVVTKLEEKVRKTMGEIAELNEEKQRLEHLVLQLQGETETIGEYITLYQIQRGMLRQRVQEKDEQVAQLARDKEALRNKLSHLNCLVQRLVGQQQVLNGANVLEPEEEVKEAIPQLVSHTASQGSSNRETAEQIKSLLSEIGSNNLVTSSTENSNINFHPCPCCSGRLITV